MNQLTKQLADALRAVAYFHGHVDPHGHSDAEMRGPLSDSIRVALAAYNTASVDLNLNAAELLVHAYARGEARGGSTDWDDINQAWQAAVKELGPERVAQIVSCYAEEDEDEAL